MFRRPMRLEKWIAYDGALGADVAESVQNAEFADSADNMADTPLFDEPAGSVGGDFIDDPVDDVFAGSSFQPFDISLSPFAAHIEDVFSVLNHAGEMTDALIRLPGDVEIPDGGDSFLPFWDDSDIQFDSGSLGGASRNNIPASSFFFELTAPDGGKFTLYEWNDSLDAKTFARSLELDIRSWNGSWFAFDSGRTDENGNALIMFKRISRIGSFYFFRDYNWGQDGGGGVFSYTEEGGIRFLITENGYTSAGNNVAMNLLKSVVYTPDEGSDKTHLDGFSLNVYYEYKADYHSNPGLFSDDEGGMFHEDRTPSGGVTITPTTSIPDPDPDPDPSPDPDPDPDPGPNPDPDPDPDPGPNPDPDPDPDPDPSPDPDPDPDPGPSPDPDPDPDPGPSPDPDPDPDPGPSPDPDPDPDPGPNPDPDPEPDPGPNPEVPPTSPFEPGPEPEPAPDPEPIPELPLDVDSEPVTPSEPESNVEPLQPSGEPTGDAEVPDVSLVGEIATIAVGTNGVVGSNGEAMAYIFMRNDEEGASERGERGTETESVGEGDDSDERAGDVFADGESGGPELEKDLDTAMNAVRAERVLLEKALGRLQKEYLSRPVEDWVGLKLALRELFVVGNRELRTLNRILEQMGVQGKVYRDSPVERRDGLIEESLRELMDSASRRTLETTALSSALNTVTDRLRDSRVGAAAIPAGETLTALFVETRDAEYERLVAGSERNDPMGRELASYLMSSR